MKLFHWFSGQVGIYKGKGLFIPSSTNLFQVLNTSKDKYKLGEFLNTGKITPRADYQHATHLSTSKPTFSVLKDYGRSGRRNPKKLYLQFTAEYPLSPSPPTAQLFGWISQTGSWYPILFGEGHDYLAIRLVADNYNILLRYPINNAREKLLWDGWLMLGLSGYPIMSAYGGPVRIKTKEQCRTLRALANLKESSVYAVNIRKAL